MNIYIIGNPLVEQDNTTIKFLPQLKQDFPQHNFILYDPVEDIESKGEIIVIDIVKGLEKPRIIKLDEIKSNDKNMHDLGIGMMFKMMKRLGKIKDVRIIGIPEKCEYDDLKTILIDF